jgi:hypothetical protein
MREGRFCATLFRTARNSLILNGEMSEWSIEHAWKSDLFTRADAQQNPPTHVRSISSRYNEVLRDAPVSDDVHRGFRGVCDTVLTQEAIEVTPYDSMRTTNTRNAVQQVRAFRIY